MRVLLEKINRAESLITSRHWHVMGLFFALVLLLRWSSFYLSVVDWDESLYLLMADAWLRGHPPYTVVWDNKPPGIYALFAAALTTFGHSVAAIRLAACLFVTGSCYLLYRIGDLIVPGGKRVGLLAGLIYASATISNGGLAANTELFYATFVLFGFWLIADRGLSTVPGSGVSRPWWFYVGIGVSLGSAFQIKYVVIPDIIALCVVLAWYEAKSGNRPDPKRAFRSAVLTAVGFLVPCAVVWLYFWATGALGDFIYANFTANRLRVAASLPHRGIFLHAQNDLFSWLAVPGSVAYVLFMDRVSATERRFVLSVAFWFLAQLAFILGVLKGFRYTHYYLQMAPPLSLIAAYAIANLAFPFTRAGGGTARSFIVCGAFLVFLVATPDVLDSVRMGFQQLYHRQVRGIRHWNDQAGAVADYLRSHRKPGDSLFVVDSEPVIYFLTGADIPTRYPFPPFLFPDATLPNIIGKDPQEELARVLAGEPTFVVADAKPCNPKPQTAENVLAHARVRRALDERYRLETTIGDINVYRLSGR